MGAQCPDLAPLRPLACRMWADGAVVVVVVRVFWGRMGGVIIRNRQEVPKPTPGAIPHCPPVRISESITPRLQMSAAGVAPRPIIILGAQKSKVLGGARGQGGM